MTIIQGEAYRAVADVKTIRDIPIKSPRGNIYDRNGVLLAGNLPSFTVQIRKDDIKSKDFNEMALLLATILDQKNERIIDEFPIILNSIVFDSDVLESDYFYPEELVENIIIENNLMQQIFSKMNDREAVIDLKERMLLILSREIQDIPVGYDGMSYLFVNSDMTYNSPEEYLTELIYQNSHLIRKLLANSEIRKFIYEIIDENDLAEDLKLLPYTYTYDNEYNQIKKDLIKKSDAINFQTDAKSDFSHLVRLYCKDYFFRKIFYNNEIMVLPGVMLYERVLSEYPELPIVYLVDEGAQSIFFNFTSNEEKTSFIQENGYTDDITAYSILIEYALKSDEDFDVITSDDVKFFAQSELLSYINPSISVSSWEYTAIIKKENWIKANTSHNTQKLEAQDVFLQIKEASELNDEISDYLARNVFVIKERYIKQGYLAYHPIDISYNVSEKTVALLSENKEKLTGVEIVVQPLRDYPQGSSAAHILGYLGKISQDYEIVRYIDQQGYAPDDLIGKTGIEESFELMLSGVKGKETLKVDVYGNRIGTVETEEPEPGDNLYLTIDIELQKKAETYMQKALEEIRKGGSFESKWGDFDFDHTYKNAYSGALVALDVNTGEVLAMVNYPSYDPNLFSSGISQEDWQSLLNESKDLLAPRPLYNIAMLTAVQPGSTFKMVTALAALEKGISPTERIYCAGYMEIGSQTFGCWIWNMYKSRHGYENMYEAIRDSCNFYFYTLVLGENKVTGEKTSVKVDLQDILSIAEQLGLNQKTGIEINIPNEASGGIPDPKMKISNIKYFLRNYLDKSIEQFYPIGYTFNEDEKAQLINEIVSWVNGNEPLTRTQVYENLKKIRLNPDKMDENGIPLVDLIKYSYLNQAVWNDGDTLNISIGQGNNSYTPLQMANYIATIANGGYLHNISVISKATSYDGQTTTYEPDRITDRILLKDYGFLDEVTKGMMMVSEDSKSYKNFPVEVASKTGTAEKDGLNPETGEPYDEFAWYVAFAPAKNPQIAVAAVIFQGGSGRFPAPVVREVIGDYLKLEPETVQQ
ncbi:MAG: penicillin-binding protein [Tissierellales bacterium]|nr:penicillin-binding protein [Tissierellales bacterium]MBN2827856.1 penicillin-binding protein [Tissierellales bacterium]